MHTPYRTVTDNASLVFSHPSVCTRFWASSTIKSGPASVHASLDTISITTYPFLTAARELSWIHLRWSLYFSKNSFRSRENARLSIKIASEKASSTWGMDISDDAIPLVGSTRTDTLFPAEHRWNSQILFHESQSIKSFPEFVESLSNSKKLWAIHVNHW